MLERIYFSLWALLILTVGIFYVAGGLSTLTIVVFGFILFGLTFMGMIGVLPFWASHHSEANTH